MARRKFAREFKVSAVTLVNEMASDPKGIELGFNCLWLPLFT